MVGRLSGIQTQNGQTNWEDCGPCPVFTSYALAFALQLRKKHSKTTFRVAVAVGRVGLKKPPTIFTVSVICVCVCVLTAVEILTVMRLHSVAAGVS